MATNRKTAQGGIAQYKRKPAPKNPTKQQQKSIERLAKLTGDIEKSGYKRRHMKNVTGLDVSPVSDHLQTWRKPQAQKTVQRRKRQATIRRNRRK